MLCTKNRTESGCQRGIGRFWYKNHTQKALDWIEGFILYEKSYIIHLPDENSYIVVEKSYI